VVGLKKRSCLHLFVSGSVRDEALVANDHADRYVKKPRGRKKRFQVRGKGGWHRVGVDISVSFSPEEGNRWKRQSRWDLKAGI
jgi:hypothetical protein